MLQQTINEKKTQMDKLGSCLTEKKGKHHTGLFKQRSSTSEM